MRRLVRCLAWSAAVAPAAAVQEPPTGQFTEQVEVRVRSAIVSITDASGKPPSRLPTKDELIVREDGKTLTVIGVEPLRGGAIEPGPSPRPPERTPSQPAAPAPPGNGLPQYLYVDPAGLWRRSPFLVAQAIEQNLDALLRVGPLEIVLADPEPRILLASSSDPARVRASLAAVSKASAPADSIFENRWQTRRDIEQAMGAAEVRMLIRISVQQEILRMRQYTERLEAWAASLHEDRPGILYLCNDGFDSDPTETYRGSLRDAGDLPSRGDRAGRELPNNMSAFTAQLFGEFAQSLAPLEERMTLALAGRGLRIVAIAPGSLMALSSVIDVERQGGLDAAPFARGDEPYFARPHEPLGVLADATGGEVVTTPQRLGAAVGRLAGAYLVSFRSALPPDGKAHTLEVTSARADLKIRAQRLLTRQSPESIAAARAIRGLAGDLAAAGGLAVSASVTPGPAKGKRRTGQLLVRTNLSSVAEALASLGAARVRVTVAVQVRRSEPFVQSEEFELRPSQTTWEYEAPLEWPKEAERVSVTVEELKTGSHGETAVDLPGAP